MPKRLPQQFRKKKFLCPLEKNTQSETDLINKASDMRDRVNRLQGASETVIPHDQIRGYEIREKSSTKGMNFVSASGDPIPNLGEQVLPLLTEEETLRTMKFNACPVTKALGSVKRMCNAGHTVVLMCTTNTRERRT